LSSSHFSTTELDPTQLTSPASPRIVPPASGLADYVIRQEGASETFADFARLTGFGATGRFAGLASEFTACRARAMLD